MKVTQQTIVSRTPLSTKERQQSEDPGARDQITDLESNLPHHVWPNQDTELKSFNQSNSKRCNLMI